MNRRRLALVGGGLAAVIAVAFALGVSLSSSSEQAQAGTPSSDAAVAQALARLDEGARSFGACAEAQGYTVITRPGSGLRPTEVTIAGGPETSSTAAEAAARARADVLRCEEQSALPELQRAFLATVAVPDAATRARHFAWLRECVADGGVAGDDVLWIAYDGIASHDEIAVAPHERERYAQCALRLQEETGWRAPAPAAR